MTEFLKIFNSILILYKANLPSIKLFVEGYKIEFKSFYKFNEIKFMEESEL